MEELMVLEKILQDRQDLLSVVNNWSREGERLLIYENDDTLVLKKMKKSISTYADDSYNDRMSMEEVVREVHKNRHH
jgi:hypothetical protein